MNYRVRAGLLSTTLVLILMSCNNGPKVISTPVNEDSNTEQSTGIFSEEGHNTSTEARPAINKDMHTVTVKEVLPTSKYVYLYVEEGESEFWIAAMKQEVNVGETYFYQGGLLKTNFESKEYNRVFDKMYLVSKIVPANHNNANASTTSDNTQTEEKKAATTPRKIDKEGSVKIADIISNPEKYDGKTIQVSGECVKINPNIMGRNWVHLKDGSLDDYDFVITTDAAIPEGHVITMTGTVVLNKDFGAGYKYDVIIEDGAIVQ